MYGSFVYNPDGQKPVTLGEFAKAQAESPGHTIAELADQAISYAYKRVDEVLGEQLVKGVRLACSSYGPEIEAHVRELLRARGWTQYAKDL